MLRDVLLLFVSEAEVLFDELFLCSVTGCPGFLTFLLTGIIVLLLTVLSPSVDLLVLLLTVELLRLVFFVLTFFTDDLLFTVLTDVSEVFFVPTPASAVFLREALSRLLDVIVLDTLFPVADVARGTFTPFVIPASLSSLRFLGL